MKIGHERAVGASPSKLGMFYAANNSNRRRGLFHGKGLTGDRWDSFASCTRPNAQVVPIVVIDARALVATASFPAVWLCRYWSSKITAKPAVS